MTPGVYHKAPQVARISPRRCLGHIPARSAAHSARTLILVSLLAAIMVPMPAAHARPLSNCRFYIAHQHDFERKVGFFLDLIGGDLQQLTLTLAVGDGKAWRYAECTPGFVVDREYAVRAIAGPDGAQLVLDGKLAAQSPGAWQPTAAPLEVNYRPAFSTQGEWLAAVRRISIVVTRGGKELADRSFDFAETSARPLALQLFEPGDHRAIELEVSPGDTVTMEATLRIAAADLKRWAPYVDAYGQCRYADWPEKIRSDDDLRADVAREDAELAKMPPSPDYDEYGGYLKAGWREPATGFFHVTKRNGYWWLTTPAGNPCFYLGVCEIPAATYPSTPIAGREFLFEWLPSGARWSTARGGSGDSERVSFHAANLIRKYGSDWLEKTTARAVRRVRAFGFSGGGKWGAPPELVSLPVLGRGRTPSLVMHPDIFDPKVCDAFRSDLESQIAPQRDNPRILGWSLGNEWDEIIPEVDVTGILAKPADVPAKRALADYAVDEIYAGSLRKLAEAWKVSATDRAALYASAPKPPPEDIEKLRRFYAERYYDFIYRTVKSIDPNHLYFGFWMMVEWGRWWPNEADWRIIARHCDVIGYDRYAQEYDSARWRQMEAEAGKPTLCGEFGFPAWYDGMHGFGRYPAAYSRDDAEAGELYYRWVQAAARDAYSVGSLFFVYRDQPITGRGPGRGPRLIFGEDYAFGVITETDRPKWALVRRVREANLKAAQWRLSSAGK
jgi:hypothetical protein